MVTEMPMPWLHFATGVSHWIKFKFHYKLPTITLLTDWKIGSTSLGSNPITLQVPVGQKSINTPLCRAN